MLKKGLIQYITKEKKCRYYIRWHRYCSVTRRTIFTTRRTPTAITCSSTTTRRTNAAITTNTVTRSCHMSCHVMSCHLLSSLLLSSRVMSCHVMSCHVTPRLTSRVVERSELVRTWWSSFEAWRRPLCAYRPSALARRDTPTVSTLPNYTKSILLPYIPYHSLPFA